MAMWNGLDTLVPHEHPLMGVFARLLGGGNLIAPVCGALSVMLVKMSCAWFVLIAASCTISIRCLVSSGCILDSISSTTKTDPDSKAASHIPMREKSGVGLRFVRELEQGKQTLRMDKINQVLALFGHEVGAVPAASLRQ